MPVSAVPLTPKELRCTRLITTDDARLLKTATQRVQAFARRTHAKPQPMRPDIHLVLGQRCRELLRDRQACQLGPDPHPEMWRYPDGRYLYIAHFYADCYRHFAVQIAGHAAELALALEVSEADDWHYPHAVPDQEHWCMLAVISVAGGVLG